MKAKSNIEHDSEGYKSLSTQTSWMGKRIINTGKPGLPRDIRRPASPSTADARISSATDLRLALLFSILASIANKKQTLGQGILVTFLDFLRKKYQVKTIGLVFLLLFLSLMIQVLDVSWGLLFFVSCFRDALLSKDGQGQMGRGQTDRTL